jgi:hypothetical protein
MSESVSAQDSRLTAEPQERMSKEDAIEVEASCGRERSGSPQPKSRAICARDLKIFKSVRSE